jgi:hypothetical protein
LLSIGYKVFASILSSSLQAGGSDDRLWHSQFGFRRGRSTEDAIFIAPRSIEQACAWRGPGSLFLVIDWKKAFDSSSLEGLVQASRRYGIPEALLDMIRARCADQKFVVSDSGSTSDPRPQRAGIFSYSRSELPGRFGCQTERTWAHPCVQTAKCLRSWLADLERQKGITGVFGATPMCRGRESSKYFGHPF